MQFAFRNDAWRPVEQRGEQLEGLGCQVDIHPVAPDPVSHRIEFEPAETRHASPRFDPVSARVSPRLILRRLQVSTSNLLLKHFYDEARMNKIFRIGALVMVTTGLLSGCGHD